MPINSPLSTGLQYATPASRALYTLAASANNPSQGRSWYEALARALGGALDGQADTIEQMSVALGQGNDRPSDLTMLTTEAARMQFLSNSASTSLNSVGQSLETVARKG